MIGLEIEVSTITTGTYVFACDGLTLLIAAVCRARRVLAVLRAVVHGVLQQRCTMNACDVDDTMLVDALT